VIAIFNAGLGSVGARIIGQPPDLGLDVVGAAKDADATGGPWRLLLAEVAAAPGLAGQLVAAVHQPGRLRVIAIRPSGGITADWSPAPGYVIRPGDRVVILATRTGLSRLLRPGEGDSA